jgi:hypothetical protein
MKFLFVLPFLILSSCNLINSKLDMKDYLFSSKERKWSITHPTLSDLNQSFHHEPYSKDGKDFVKVTTIFRRIKTIEIYEFKAETIELVYHWKTGWGAKENISDKPWPRFVSKGELMGRYQYTGEKLYSLNDSTEIGNLTLKHENIEVGTSSMSGDMIFVYAKGAGLINIVSRYKPNPITGEPIPNDETRIEVNEVDWIKCQDKKCTIN